MGSIFSDGFEDGTWSDNWEDHSEASVSPAVNTNRAYSGSYSLDLASEPGSSTINEARSINTWSGEGYEYAAYINKYTDGGDSNNRDFGLVDPANPDRELFIYESSYPTNHLLLRETDTTGSTVNEWTLNSTELGTNTWYRHSLTTGAGTATAEAGSYSVSGVTTAADWSAIDAQLYASCNGWGSGHDIDIAVDDVDIIAPAPAAPSNTSATVDADDSITVTWTDNSDNEDNFRVHINRDGSGWTAPTGGPTTPGANTTTATYTPSSDNAYGSVVGLDSSFQFRVRAENVGGNSAWDYSGTVYTTPIPPHDPSVIRPDANTVDLTFTCTTDIPDVAVVQFREDTGAGYGTWTNFDDISGNETHVSGAGADNDLSTGDTITATYTTGQTYQYTSSLSEDARYQFRLRMGASGTGPWSEWVYADYGNAGNVYFSDGFESGGLTNWTTTSLADADSGVKDSTTLTAEASTDTGVSAPDEGTYLLELQAGDSVEKSLGDLSAESGVHVRAALAAGSMDSGSEAVGIEWSPDGGTTWIAYNKLSWEYNKQDWVEVHADIAAVDLGTNCRLRITGYGGTGDYLVADRIVVSDVLHEFTALPAPSALSLDATVEDQITASWTDNGTFWPNHGTDVHTQVDYRATGAATWNTATAQEGDLGSETITSLLDGEEYEIRIQNAWNQPRNGGANTWFTTVWVGPLTAITVLPAPTSLSADAVRADAVDLSWLDHHDNGDTRVDYRRTSDTAWSTFGTVARGTQVETITGLLNGEAYDARVVAQTEHTETVDQ